MLFNTALFSTLLLALSVPSISHPTAPYDQPSLLERSHPKQTAPDVAGAGFVAPTKGSVRSVSAHFTVPHVKGGGTASAAIGALMDAVHVTSNDGCFPLFSGVQVSTGDNGQPFYEVVCQFNNGEFNVISTDIRAGDVVKATIEVYDNQNTFVATVTNPRDPDHPWEAAFVVSAPICMSSGFWVVQTVPGLPLPNFGKIDMWSVQAEVSGHSVNAENAYIFNLQSGQANAFISKDGNTVGVVYA